jgi:hypothetical protein
MVYKEDDIRIARQTNLVDYCKSMGLKLEHNGSNNYKIEGFSGIVIEGNHFYNFSNETGGNAIDFAEIVLEMSFKKAVANLLDFNKSTNSSTPLANSERSAGLEKKSTAAELPIRKCHNDDVYNYLVNNRRLSSELVNNMIEMGLIYQDIHNNCVFPCFNKEGQVKGAILRGTSSKAFKGKAKGSNTDYGWILPSVKGDNAKGVIVTEAVIDALSIIDFHGHQPLRNKHFLALGGLTFECLKTFLFHYPSVTEIILGVDNDIAGKDFIEKVKEEYASQYEIIDFQPKNEKDWNEALIRKRQIS